MTPHNQSALAQTWRARSSCGRRPGRSLFHRDESSRGGSSRFKNGAAAARNAFSFCSAIILMARRRRHSHAPKIRGRWNSSCANKRICFVEWGHFLLRTSRAKFVLTALWDDLPPAEWPRLKMEKDTGCSRARGSERELTEAGPWNEGLPG